MLKSPKTQVPLMRGWLLAAACTAMALSGCYRHVVRAEGASAGQYDIHEPNLEDDDAGTPRVVEKVIPTKKTPSKQAP